MTEKWWYDLNAFLRSWDKCALLSALIWVGFDENQENWEADMLRNPNLTPAEADQSQRRKHLCLPWILQLIGNSHISSHRGTGEQYRMPDAFDAMMEDLLLKPTLNRI